MNVFTKRSGRHSLLIPFLLILAGCSFQPAPPRHFSCSNFTESYWSEFNFSADSLEDLTFAVLKLWDLDQEQVGYDVHGTTHILTWTARQDGRVRGPVHCQLTNM